MRHPRHLLIAIALITLSLGACKKDKCENVICFNGGACNEGECRCASGYEGEDCSVPERAKFLGTYNMQQSCNFGDAQYTLEIEPSFTYIRAIELNNVAGVMDVIAYATASSLAIPVQQVTVNDTMYNVQGSGSLSGNGLSLTYSVSATGVSHGCQATGTRQ